PAPHPVVGPVSSGDEWSRLVRRTQAERAAAKRRHPASGPAQPDRKSEETTMPKNINSQDATPDWWCGACPDPDVCPTTGRCTLQADMDGRRRKVDALIAAARAGKRDR